MKKLMLALLGAVVVLSSCKKDSDSYTPTNTDDYTPTESKSVSVDASAFDKWIYFSFETGAVVEVADFTTSLDWDIAFHRSNIRLNCGKSGKGKGGCLSLGKVSFDAVAEVPAEGIYEIDATMKVVKVYKQPMVEVEEPANVLMSQWVSMSGMGASGPIYTVNDNIYIVRTAKDRYAKVWLNAYLKEGKGGFITMKYAYQKDGSRKF